MKKTVGILLLLSIFACKKQNPNKYRDPQVVIDMGDMANTTSTDPVTVAALIKFSKKNYPGVDSIVFAANAYVANSNNTSHVQLYNMTTNQPIGNSEIIANGLYNDTLYLRSSNIYKSLPEDEVMIGVQLRSGIPGMFAGTGKCYLYLYRR